MLENIKKFSAIFFSHDRLRIACLSASQHIESGLELPK